MILPIPHERFAAFLVTAKGQTYATQGDDATVTPLLPGSRQLEYRDGPLLYRDIYLGGAYFVGQETVYYNSSALWAMGYAGGLASAAVRPAEMGRVYDFLRAALRQVAADRPYRGPSTFRQGEYIYRDESQGEVDDFWGVETITHQDQQIYQLHYSGGLLR
jgi:hypothetical protein